MTGSIKVRAVPIASSQSQRHSTLTLVLATLVFANFSALVVPLASVLRLRDQFFITKAVIPRSNLTATELDPIAVTTSRYGCTNGIAAARVEGDVELDDDTVRNISKDNRSFTYFPGINVMITTLAKGGSSSVFQTMFLGLTGIPWDREKMGNAHNQGSPAWVSHVTDWDNLSLAQQRRILSSSSPGSTLCIAVQRDPFDRLISAFKSKATCEYSRYKGYSRKSCNYFVLLLRRHANIPPSSQQCMNMSEFSNALDRLRINIGKPGFASSFLDLDIHLKPQDFFFDLIDYHLVLDVSDWSDLNKMKPLHDRLRYANEVRKQSSVLHKSFSSKEILYLTDKAAASFHRFAMLFKPGVLKCLS